MSDIKADNLPFASKCEFSLLVDDIVTGIPINKTEFTLYDSIYNLYAKANFRILDTNALYNEYMGFVDGTKIEINYGLTQESWKTNRYRIIQNSIPEQNSPELLGGYLDISLIHDYFNTQTKKSKAYDSNISDIVYDLVRDYNFSLIDIDRTLNSGIWYQPYMSDAEFIMNNLLPFSYSTDAGESPFYCFINSNNEFRFKSYKSLMEQTPKQTYYLKSKGLLNVELKDTIYSLSYAQIPVSEIKPFYNRLFYAFNGEGDYVKNAKNHYISDFPKYEINSIPIKVNLNNVTSVFNVYDDDIKLDETYNNNMGLKINSLKKSMLVDKLIINVPFTRDICAGDCISINIPSPSESVSEGGASLRFSGKYLVEASYQKWNGSKSYTTLVCGKQTVKVTNDYRNVALIVNRDKR